jgi:Ca2+-binding RTX toxin-like protein
VKPRLIFQIALFGLLLLIFVSAATAFAANLTISPSNVGVKSIAVRANDLKPEACSGLDLTNIVSGSGMIDRTGYNGSELIIGSSGDDTIKGGGGDDCILGGGGNDAIDGGDGMDVCIGGAGVDTFSTCEKEIQ